VQQRVVQLTQQVRQLRTIGGPALQAAEGVYDTALKAMQKVTAKLNAPGLSRLGRALLKKSQEWIAKVRDFAKRTKEVTGVQQNVTRRAIATGVVPPTQGPNLNIPASLPTRVVKDTTTGATSQLVQDVGRQLEGLRDLAQSNLRNGTFTSNSGWIPIFRNMATTHPDYARLYGNALEAELKALIGAEQAAQRLPRGILLNKGAFNRDLGFTNSFGRQRPDIRLLLDNGMEAIWDLTTAAQSGVSGGHVGQYASRTFVQYAADLPYIR
jgi:hypothetical protein